MTPSLAAALSTSPTPPAPLDLGRRRGAAGPGGDFPALLGAVGGDAAPAERPELASQSRPATDREQPDRRSTSPERQEPRREVAERRREDAAAARAVRASLRRQAADAREDARAQAREDRERSVDNDASEADDRARLDESQPTAVGPGEGAAGTSRETAPQEPTPVVDPNPVVAVPALAKGLPGDGLVTGDTAVGEAAAALGLPDAQVPGPATQAGPGAALTPVGLVAPDTVAGQADGDSLAEHGLPSVDAGPASAVEGPGLANPEDVPVLDGATALPGEAVPLGSGTSAGADAHTGSDQQQATAAPAVSSGSVAEEVVLGGPAAVLSPTDGPGATGPAGASARTEATLVAAAQLGDASVDPAAEEAPVLRTQLGDAVADLARAAHRDGSGATRVVIRLDPPELGTVTVALTVRGGDVRVSLVATEVGAVQALDSRRDEVQAALADAGLALDSYDVQSGPGRGQEQQQQARERAAAAGRPWRALGPEMDWERAAAVDRAARGLWL